MPRDALNAELQLALAESRRREQALRGERDALLAGLAAVVAPQSPSAVFAGTAEVFREQIGFDQAFVLRGEAAGPLRPALWTDAALEGTEWPVGRTLERVLAGEVVNVFNAALLPDLAAVLPPGGAVQSLLLLGLPGASPRSVLGFAHAGIGRFRAGQVGLARQVLPLFHQLLRAAELRFLERRLVEAEEEADALRHARAEQSSTLRTLQAEVARQERLASLGRLLAGIAHEVATPLGVSVTASALVTEHIDALAAASGGWGPAAQGWIAGAQEAHALTTRNVRRAADLLRAFRQVAVDPAASASATVDAAGFLAEALQSARPAVAAPVVEWVLDAGPPEAVRTRPGPLGQVIGALLENAVHHAFTGRAGGRVCLRGRLTRSAWVITVNDDGVGMPSEQVASAFEPFTGRRARSSGRGLGLFVAHNLVTGVFGGTVELRSSPATGTTVALRLPRDEAGAVVGPGDPGGPH
jgi:signal transduction histidine kinase